MIGGIVALLIAVWFYNTASRAGKNPLQWMIAGIIAYYGTMLVWTYWIVSPLLGRFFDRHSLTAGLAIELSAVGAGALCAIIVRSKLLKATPIQTR